MADKAYYKMIDKATERQVKKYIADPDTRVFIDRKDETGELLYVVQVENTDFWLNTFKYKKDAIKYTKENHLQMVK